MTNQRIGLEFRPNTKDNNDRTAQTAAHACATMNSAVTWRTRKANTVEPLANRSVAAGKI